MNICNEFQVNSFENAKDQICAEVFISSEQFFYISCRYCNNNTFKNYEKFTKHFYETHIDNKIEDTSHNYKQNSFDETETLFANDNIQTEEIFIKNNSAALQSSFSDDINENCNTETETGNNSEHENNDNTKSIKENEININLKNIDHKKYHCTLCPTKYWTFEQLSLHKIIHKFKKTTRNQKIPLKKHKIQLRNLQNSNKSTNRFKCSQCLSTFWSFKQLELHKTSHNFIDDKSKLKDKNISHDDFLMIGQPIEEFYNKILEKNKATKQQCDTCGMCFSSATSLKRHIMKHTGERPFKCEHCSKGFIRRHALILHLGAHSGEKQFKCEQCNKAYYRKDALHHHMKSHSDNVYACNYCDKKFKINSEKNYHERRHNIINRKRKSRKEKNLTALIEPIKMKAKEIKKELS